MLTNGRMERISMHHEQTRNYQFHLYTCSRLRIACNSSMRINVRPRFWFKIKRKLTHPYRFAIYLVYMCPRNGVSIHRIIPTTTNKSKIQFKIEPDWGGRWNWASAAAAATVNKSWTYFKAIDDKQMQNATK